MRAVQLGKARGGGGLNLGRGDMAIAGGVHRADRLHQRQNAESRLALRTARSVVIAAMIATPAAARGHGGGHRGLIGLHLSRIDHAVVVGVEAGGKGGEISGELGGGQMAIVMGIGAGEPVGHRVGARVGALEHLARGGDENLWARGPPAMAGMLWHIGRGRHGGRVSALRGQRGDQGKQHGYTPFRIRFPHPPTMLGRRCCRRHERKSFEQHRISAGWKCPCAPANTRP